MFAQVQLSGDITIAKTIGNKSDHLLLARREKIHSFRIYHTQRWHMSNRIDQMLQVCVAQPDLARVDAQNALTQKAKRILRERKQTARPRAERIDRHLAV